jgi:WhiB family redox-sensing transcriptional regulator
LLAGVPVEQGACYGQPDVMFPETTAYRPAKALCRVCPITAECLSLALSMPQEDDLYGVWGGLTAPERRRLRTAGPAA